GGDEAPKVRWEECPLCQARMKEEGLANEEELQRWFIGRMGRYLATKGKTIIGWDEILEGGLPEGAAVQSWRGM
ncbi:MAG: family 20 glycosylhydrolase, partial [Flavobacteriales bacterium]